MSWPHLGSGTLVIALALVLTPAAAAQDGGWVNPDGSAPPVGGSREQPRGSSPDGSADDAPDDGATGPVDEGRPATGPAVSGAPDEEAARASATEGATVSPPVPVLKPVPERPAEGGIARRAEPERGIMEEDDRVTAAERAAPRAPWRKAAGQAQRLTSPVSAEDLGIPRGHLPPPGACRIWYPDRPPGQQPPPGSCGGIVPPGAVLVRGR